jgi:hypothetical protein
MTTTPHPANGIDVPIPTGDFRSMLADPDDPAAYWEQLATLLSLYLGVLRRQQRHCSADGCGTCKALVDVVAIAQAHNSMQTFDEVAEVYRPYALLSYITSGCGSHRTTGATA